MCLKYAPRVAQTGTLINFLEVNITMITMIETKEKNGAYKTLTGKIKGASNLDEIIIKARKAGYALFM